ncbi:MAG: YfcE family phosphodiesterase [Chloroflexota bacterium]|nr:YfcE family phosphodiesterase [Chloroflexota bacterium]
MGSQFSENTVRILVVGDTHAYSFSKIPTEIMEIAYSVDWLIHVGDYVSYDVLRGFRELKGDRFRGVHGNADPMSIRMELPMKDILELHGKRIGMSHPAQGGPHEDTVERVRGDFLNHHVDMIVYGHTHDPKIEDIEGVLLLSPGKGYKEVHSFGAPASVGIVIIDGSLNASIQVIEL